MSWLQRKFSQWLQTGESPMQCIIFRPQNILYKTIFLFQQIHECSLKQHSSVLWKYSFCRFPLCLRKKKASQNLNYISLPKSPFSNFVKHGKKNLYKEFSSATSLWISGLSWSCHTGVRQPGTGGPWESEHTGGLFTPFLLAAGWRRREEAQPLLLLPPRTARVLYSSKKKNQEEGQVWG